ncbi:hypothetical protein OVA14_00295 [Agrococcus sp. SL85]|uniref:hypothetical protein n=1 Tax=Agrococcus sp. SL85 TaxID=2995141 RepID=UPI00226C8155|nr:hypothetical protein [Agrococcus sp. SL85]WAC66283.1 hypothetical protein OVA14_00295 [Agrococcus sp. SL85]
MPPWSRLALNAEAGPVVDDLTLVAIVAAARVAGLPVAAHVQGAGQAERAIEHGVAILAHAPWSEALPRRVIEAAAARTTWISTLGMHRRDGDDAAWGCAVDNLLRFAQAGGAVLHGTDLGNGTSRLGIDDEEVASLVTAALGAGRVVDALVGAPLDALLGRAASSTTALPEDVADDEAAIWSLHAARAVTAADLDPASFAA